MPRPAYRASPALESAILALAPPHVATQTAPSNLPELLAAWERYILDGTPLPVYDGACDRTIYSSARVNHAFRAWHDSIHVTLAAEFNAAGERAVSAAAVETLRRWPGITQADLLAMHFEVVGQLEYAARHGGEFPVDQAAFIAACFDDYHSAIRATF